MPDIMQYKLIFATGNLHKVSEVRQLAGPHLQILTPAEVGINASDFPETSDTLQGNAIEKVNALYETCRQDCFAEDTGLEVEALDGAPGVYTARYAGPGCSPQDNIEKLLAALLDQDNRAARFRTVIALRWMDNLHLFEGLVDGRIAMQSKGTGGFGYDPIFIPEGHSMSFAELPSEIKNSLSHRSHAVMQMRTFIEDFAQK